MATDDNGMRDHVSAELNSTGPEPDYGPQPDRIPDRPHVNASAAEWGQYVVALGLHPDEVEKYTRQELKDLADRLGG